ncbi:MAG: hypothetical protein ABIR52_12085 [Casimicrobiaceae bacterium]
MVKTVIGSFDRIDDAHRAERALLDAGFLDSDINFIASDARRGDADVRVADDSDSSGVATGAVAGGALGGAAGLALSLMGLAIPGIGPILAAGPIVAALAGAGAGAAAGGLIGSLTGIGVEPERAEIYAESVRRGGTLVTVRTDESRADEAASILRDTGAVDIDLRVVEWRSSGWTGFDAKAEPYSFDAIERDRSNHAADLDDDFRRDYERNLAEAGAPFDEYAPAYRYGADVVRDDRYVNRQWDDDVEAELRSDWERDYPNRDWSKVRDAARYGYTRAR